MNDSKAVLSTILRLYEMYSNGKLGGEIMPEDALAGIVPREQLPDVLTLGMALNYQRNSYALWKAVAMSYQDESIRWIFDFEAVTNASDDMLRIALAKYKIGLQPNRHTQIWRRIAQTLLRAGGILVLIESHDFMIAELRDTMLHAHKKDYPYLSGPKIYNYWLYVMESYCGIVWKDRSEISVAPDTHILQASVKLGIVPASVLDGSTTSREVVALAWKELLKDTSLAPIDVHTPLWLWSRGGFIEV